MVIVSFGGNTPGIVFFSVFFFKKLKKSIIIIDTITNVLFVFFHMGALSLSRSWSQESIIEGLIKRGFSMSSQ